MSDSDFMPDCDDGSDRWDPAFEAHEAWAKRRKLQGQRERRARLRRIDFYAEPLTDRVIDALRTGSTGGDASSILNRIVAEWLTHCHTAEAKAVLVRLRRELADALPE